MTEDKIRRLRAELRDLDFRRSKSEVLSDLSVALRQSGREAEAESVRERWKDENGY